MSRVTAACQIIVFLGVTSQFSSFPNFELVKRNVITYELLCKRKRLFVDAEVIQFLLKIYPNTRKKHSMLVDISFTSLHGSLDCVVVSILKLQFKKRKEFYNQGVDLKLVNFLNLLVSLLQMLPLLWVFFHQWWKSLFLLFK